MFDRLKIRVSSKPWFWNLRAWLKKVSFLFQRSGYRSITSFTKIKTNASILGSFAWIGVKSLISVVLVLAALIFIEDYVRKNLSWLPPLSAEDKKFNLEQLRLYAQLLTAIFSIYFATIGIILSSGYTRLRRDIIQMLTNEQVGSVYSQVLVLAATFCLVATALPPLRYEPGFFVYTVGTILTLLSTLALFPLGQRLFNFFDLNLLVRSEIMPRIVRNIEDAASHRNSISLANHYSKSARQALEQLTYIDDRIKADKEKLEDSLPRLSGDYTAVLLYYLQHKHRIDQESYWFPRRRKHKQWFLAGDSTTSIALQTCNQQMLVEEKPDHQWLENEIINRMADHIELAFQVGDFDLALKLIGDFSNRILAYAVQFQFDIGLREIKRFKGIIEQAFASSSESLTGDEIEKKKIGIADTWAVLGSNLCLETLRRMITFEIELKRFFESDEWSEKSLHRLPPLLQVELSFVVERIKFEQEIEGQRLSKPKYLQQLAVQKLLQYYAKVLPAVCDFYQNLVPDFVASLEKLKMSKAATQVVLANLHNHWKLPRWLEDLTKLLDRYQQYKHYTEKQYTLPEINISEMSGQLASARDDTIAKLGDTAMVKHIFEQKYDDELPDHFGQIYFELAEACINALEQNDECMLSRVLPMFLNLAFLAADSKFASPSFDVDDEFRLHLISAVINDLASVFGFAILYGAYFGNSKLSEGGLAQFDNWINQITNKQQYLKRMILLSNSYNFSIRALPRNLIRTTWKMSFESRARNDGFGDQMPVSIRGEKPHPNKIVRAFLGTFSEASHLFFAMRIVPQLGPIDFKIDQHIIDLARRLHDHEEA